MADRSQESAAQLAILFRETKTLTHIDVSKCELSADHCRVIAEALQETRARFMQIWGGRKRRARHQSIIRAQTGKARPTGPRATASGMRKMPSQRDMRTPWPIVQNCAPDS